MKIIKGSAIPWVGVNNAPEIKKQTFIGNEMIPKLMMFGKAIFKPGQKVGEHTHATMFEVYYILSGKASFTVNQEENIVEKDSCIVIEPGELHYQSNPFQEDVEWIYFGVATD